MWTHAKLSIENTLRSEPSRAPSQDSSVEELREALELRDTFLSVASHELKTPLTPIFLRLQMLARSTDAQPESAYVLEVRKQLGGAQRQLHKLTELVNDLLDVSRISAGRFRMELEQVDFTALVREVATRQEEQAEQVGSQLIVETPERILTETSRPRLEQVVTNLLDNAIKYGGGKRVEVRVGHSADRLTFSVTDYGIGIAPEYQSRIFERFERAVSDRHYGGLGLGLYITRVIVETLGGTIQVRSILGQGATFLVDLPLHVTVREKTLPLEQVTRSLAEFFRIPEAEAGALLNRMWSGQNWEPGPAEGTALMPVRAGREAGALSAFLVKVQRGITYPYHVHEDHDERVFVFQGGFVEPDGRETWAGETALRACGTGHWTKAIEDCYLAALQLPISPGNVRSSR